jgi:hypothetical protein
MSDNKTTKVAAAEASQQEVITQKQLDNAGPLHARTDTLVSVTTEAQLAGKGDIKPLKDTTSDSNQLQHGKAAEVITEAQLAALAGDLARWNSFPEVITEAQWDEMSRRVSTTLGADYTSQITQAQLTSLQKSHKWVAPEVITQAQLNAQKKVALQTDSERVASSAKDLIKAASNTIVDAIANYGLSPADISKAINVMTVNPYAQIKAGLLTLVNAAPNKVETRKANIDRKNYFNKLASVSIDNPVDSMLAAMGDNIGYNKAEDFVDALKFAVSNNKVFASAESQAQIKIASANAVNSNPMSKEDIFASAFAEMNRSDDGLYKVCGTLSDDVTVDPDNKSEFHEGITRICFKSY